MKVPDNYIIVNSVVVISVLVVAYVMFSVPLSSLPQDVAVSIGIGGVVLFALCMILLDLMVLHERIKRLLGPNNPTQNQDGFDRRAI